VRRTLHIADRDEALIVEDDYYYFAPACDRINGPTEGLFDNMVGKKLPHAVIVPVAFDKLFNWLSVEVAEWSIGAGGTGGWVIYLSSLVDEMKVRLRFYNHISHPNLGSQSLV
jgi:DNA-binding transcriptional MocR family regulator